MQTIVLAAGRGTRMGPLTATTPKPMQPLTAQPLLSHVLETAVGAGADEFVLVTGYGGENIREYFGTSFHGVPITYATQETPTGTADAVAAGSDVIDGPFAVLNGDCLYKPTDLRRLFENGPSIGICEVDNPTEYGVVTMSNGHIDGIVEKPADPPTAYANTGAYVFPHDAMEGLAVDKSPRGEYELTDVVSGLLTDRAMHAVEFDGWMDIGYPWELLAANERLLAEEERALEGTVHPDATIAGNVVVEAGATVKEGVTIIGPARIRAGSTVGPNAYIRGATLVCPNVTVGHAVEIKNSMLMDGSAVPHHSYVGDSIVGRNANLGAGTKIANLRHDREPVKLTVNGERVSTGRTKFGAVIGDNVQTGINTSICPGVTLSTGATTTPGETVSRDR